MIVSFLQDAGCLATLVVGNREGDRLERGQAKSQIAQVKFEHGKTLLWGFEATGKPSDPLPEVQDFREGDLSTSLRF
jgi:hypothetical protein